MKQNTISKNKTISQQKLAKIQIVELLDTKYMTIFIIIKIFKLENNGLGNVKKNNTAELEYNINSKSKNYEI